MTVGLGALATGIVATVDDCGTVRRGPAVLQWRVRSGSRWLDATHEPTVRQVRPTAAPLVATSVRVPGGDVVHRAWAVSDGGGAVVVEVENESPEAVVVALALRGAPPRWLSRPRAPRAQPGPLADAGAHELAFPLPHRTRLRVALAERELDVHTLAGAEAVTRAWERLLDHGMRTELPVSLQREVDAARADLLLAAPSAGAFATLEAWGFDAEAAAMWPHLGFGARRAARRRRARGLLAELSAALVHEAGSVVELVPGFRAEWVGAPLAVHDAPARRGRCSFALRWHGSRPAVLWDLPPGSTVRAPALDPGWSSASPRGEALLAAPPAVLLPAGATGPRGHTATDAPDVFR